jgi:hypothetical protein
MAMGSVITEGTTRVETVYVGTRDAGVFRSLDDGQSWAPARSGLAFFPIRTLVTDPQDPTILYAGTDYNGVWKSTDGGETWQEKASGIAFVQDFVYDPRNPRWVYAATEGYGVLRSFDGGESWHDYSSGIFYPVLYSLDITTDDPPLLVAGSYGSGLYWIRPAAPKHVFLPLVVRSHY